MSSEAIKGRKIFQIGPGTQDKKHQKSSRSKSSKKNIRPGSDGLKEVTLIEVRHPITYATRYGRSHTDFEVFLKTTSRAFTLPQSVARRRYSDFVWLRNCLAKNDAFSSLRATPSLPPKRILGRFEESFLQERMKGLQRFLRKVIEQNVYLSDTALHLFLQSDMTIQQMDAYLAGKNVLVDSKSAAVLGEQHQTVRKRPLAASASSVPSMVVSAASSPSIPNAVVSANSGPSIPNSGDSTASLPSIPNAVVSANSSPSIPNSVDSTASLPSIPNAVVSANSSPSIPNSMDSTASLPSIPNAVDSTAFGPSIPNAVAEIADPVSDASRSPTSSAVSPFPVESRLLYSGSQLQGSVVREVSLSSQSSAESLDLIIMHMEDREKSGLSEAP